MKFDFEEKQAVQVSESEIHLEMGNIFDANVDAIVVSTVKTLRVNSSGVFALQLLDRAGHFIQTELEFNYPKGVEWHQVAVTSSGNMASTSNVKSIFHAVCPSFMQSQTMQSQTNPIGLVTTNCLKRLVKENYTSIAMPSIGAGNLGYEPAMVAKFLMQSVFEFLTMNFKKKLVVRIVIRETDYHTFQVRSRLDKSFH